MEVSIFDRFVLGEPGGQEKKTFSTTPYRRVFSELEASGKELKAQYPEDSKSVEAFVWKLKETARARYKKALDGSLEPMRAEARFFLSEDRMSAFACLLQPENGGAGLSFYEFLEDMHYEGINYGILQDDLQREFERGYLHIFPVARGKLPLMGEDGKVTELFQRRKNMRLEVQNGSEVDFDQEVQLQPIRKGTVICLIRLPRAGTPGMDITGQELPSPPVAEALVPQGKNTVISRGGQALTADVDGILYIEDDQFCIHEQKIIDSGLDQFQGALQVSGNLYVEGNVDGGVEIEASGDIVINGRMGQATVTSTGGTVRIQKGIYGTEGQTAVTASGQVQSPVMEWAEIKAGASVIAETISNSSIRCGKTVYAMTGRGMIVDSRIRAGESVLCLRIGNLAGGSCHFSVGYPIHLPETWERIRSELAEVQATLEKLWKSITKLRKKGNRLSDGEKMVLEQLVEQRDIYVEKRDALTAELRNVNKALDRKSKGRIRCETLHPFLHVQIGRQTEKITTIEESCNIRLEENHILLK